MELDLARRRRRLASRSESRASATGPTGDGPVGRCRWRRPKLAPPTSNCFATQLGRLGGTIYRLRDLEATIEGRPMVPMSLLNQLRRELVARLDERRRRRRPARSRPSRSCPDSLEPILAERDRQMTDHGTTTRRRSSCRSCAGAPTRSRRPWGSASPRSTPITRTSSNTPRPSAAVRRARRAAIYPGNAADREARRSQPVRLSGQARGRRHLVRNAGGMRFCSEHGIPFVADFSLNAANPLTVELFKSRGPLRVTASYDLNVDQLLDLLRRGAALVARGRDPSANADVPHGALRLLRVPVAGYRRDQLRPAVRPPRREAPRSRRHGASAQGRRGLSQHALQRRAADGRRVSAAIAEARRPFPADRVPRRCAGRPSSARSRSIAR